MEQFWRPRLQIGVFAVLMGLSVALWLGRSHVSGAVAAIGTWAAGETAETRRGRRGSVAAPVIVARVAEARDQRVIEAVGTAKAIRAVILTAEADGEITDARAAAGMRVRQGDRLFQFDDQTAKLAVELAVKKVEDARRVLERTSYLNRRRVNSRAPVEDAESSLAQAEFELAQAETDLSKLTVTAPFSGILGIPKVESGQRVESGAELVTIDDRSELIVEFEVPERFLPRVAVGEDVTVMTPSYDGQTFGGKIKAVDSRIDPTSRSFVVRAGVPNGDDLLRPGMSFRVDVALPGSAYPSVPELAMQWRAAKSFVWVIRDGKSERVDVRAVKRLNEQVLVAGEGLSPGMLVVVEGVQRLRPGRDVAFVDPAGESTEPGTARDAATTERNGTAKTGRPRAGG